MERLREHNVEIPYYNKTSFQTTENYFLNPYSKMLNNVSTNQLDYLVNSYNDSFENPNKSEADMIWTMMPHMVAAGIDYTLILCISEYAKQLLPDFDWESGETPSDSIN